VLIRTRAVYSFTRTPTILGVRRAATAVVAVTALAAGCGGGSNDSNGGGSDPPGAALSASAYREEVNSLCRKARSEVEALSKPKSADDLDDYFQTLLTVTVPYDRRSDSLKPPAELRELHRRAVREGDRQERYLRTLIADLRRSDEPTAVLRRALPELVRSADRSNRIARQLGAKDCVEELTPPGSGSPRSTS
jgi:hypothetical protein